MKSFIFIGFKMLIAVFLFSQLQGCGLEQTSTNSPRVEITSQGTEELHADGVGVRSVTDQKSDSKDGRRVKPGASVSLKDSQPLYASIPGTHDYQLRLISPYHSGNMTVSLSSSDDIKIISGKSQFEFELRDGGEYILPITVIAPKKGRFYIQLQVSITVDGQSSRRTVAAILQVGEPPVAKQKPSIKSSDANSDGVIVLPAQETISPR